MRSFLLAIIFISLSAFATERQGEHYYDFKFEEKAKLEPQQSQTQSKPLTSTETMQKLQKLHTESLNKSILAPTEENILQERLLAIMFMNMAERYQKNAQMLVNHTPSINYSLEHPVDHASRKQADSLKDARRDNKLKQLAKRYGLFVFYGGNCPHSHAFAPTAKRFASRYGFEILPISTDNVILDDFEESVVDNGQQALLGVKHIPAVFAVNPHNQKDIVLVGYGNLSVLDLANNLDMHFTSKVGQK